jgi:hypothetical protein
MRVGVRYLLRFDDMCPTMDWAVWDRVEELLVAAGVRPILAVIPDNRDPKLKVAPANPAFWDRVRAWQARGWTIGLHGYQHTYVNTEGGILRLNRQSEFAGLSFEEQTDKLQKGLAIFQRERVRADAWVAPAHSFDWVTVAALAGQGIRTISDGMALAPYTDGTGTIWIPQQFAAMRPMPTGIWTFCYHLPSLTPTGLARSQERLESLAPRMITLPEAVAMAGRRRSLGDRMVGVLRQGVSGARRLLG